MLVLVLTIILVLVLSIPLWVIHFERKSWNKGICPNCYKGEWIESSIDYIGTVGYKCNHCQSILWISCHSAYH